MRILASHHREALMRTQHLSAIVLALACTVAPATVGDDIDRIIGAIGVDAIHSENEEVRTRGAVAAALRELATTQNTAVAPLEGPAFEALVTQNIESNRRVRRDPRVWEAYRATLARMLTPEEAASAASFYSSAAGRNSHIAVVEAEKAAGLVMEQIAAGASPQSGQLAARVTEYGLYARGAEIVRPDSTAASGQSRGSSGFRLRETTTTVPLRLNQSFGFCYEISGFAPGARPNVAIQTVHPPFDRPGTEPAHSDQLVRNIVPVNGMLSDCTGYGFDHPFELVPGTWRFSVTVDGKEVLVQSFLAE